MLKMELLQLADAADGGVDGVVEAVGHEDCVIVLGRLGFQDRVGSEEGPANPVQLVQGERKVKPFHRMSSLHDSLLCFQTGGNRPWPSVLIGLPNKKTTAVYRFSSSLQVLAKL